MNIGWYGIIASMLGAISTGHIVAASIAEVAREPCTSWSYVDDNAVLSRHLFDQGVRVDQDGQLRAPKRSFVITGEGGPNEVTIYHVDEGYVDLRIAARDGWMLRRFGWDELVSIMSKNLHLVQPPRGGVFFPAQGSEWELLRVEWRDPADKDTIYIDRGAGDWRRIEFEDYLRHAVTTAPEDVERFASAELSHLRGRFYRVSDMRWRDSSLPVLELIDGIVMAVDEIGSTSAELWQEIRDTQQKGTRIIYAPKLMGARGLALSNGLNELDPVVHAAIFGGDARFGLVVGNRYDMMTHTHERQHLSQFRKGYPEDIKAEIARYEAAHLELEVDERSAVFRFAMEIAPYISMLRAIDNVRIKMQEINFFQRYYGEPLRAISAKHGYPFDELLEKFLSRTSTPLGLSDVLGG